MQPFAISLASAADTQAMASFHHTNTPIGRDNVRMGIASVLTMHAIIPRLLYEPNNIISMTRTGKNNAAMAEGDYTSTNPAVLSEIPYKPKASGGGGRSSRFPRNCAKAR